MGTPPRTNGRVQTLPLRRFRRRRIASHALVLVSQPAPPQAVPACAYDHMSEGSRWRRALL